MPGKHSPRRNKDTLLRNKSTELLFKPDEYQEGEFSVPDWQNQVKDMSQDARDEVVKFTSERIDSARDQTLAMREKMANRDKQYKSQFRDPGSSEDDIYLPKTREEVNAL